MIEEHFGRLRRVSTAHRAVRSVSCTLIVLLSLAGCAVPTPPAALSPVEANPDGTVSTIAGTGAAGFAGDDGLSTVARLNRPMALTVIPANAETPMAQNVIPANAGILMGQNVIPANAGILMGLALIDSESLLIADFNNHRVRQINLSTGVITTIAGTGQTTGDGSIHSPSGLIATRDNTFLVAAWGGHRIHEYAVDGPLLRIIGDGLATCDETQEETDLLAASFVAPRSVSVMADGSLLVSEQGCHRVRRVRSDSVVPYAGNGQAAYAGDEGPATMASIHAGSLSDGPSLGISLSPEDPPDELFIADTENHVIRQVKVFTGRMETFAGSGTPGFVDGPPEQARFNRPNHVFTATDHSLWVVDTGNHAIRFIDPLGTRVTTVAGTGEPGFNGDDLPPTETQFNGPTAVWVTPDGLVYIADAGNHRIRLFKNQ